MTQLTALLGIEIPILQAPMAGISLAPLVAAVSGAGGFGSLGSAVMRPEQVAAEVAAVRRATDRPFALNFFCHEPPEVSSERIEAARRRLEPVATSIGLEVPELGPLPPPFGPGHLQLVLDLRPKAVIFHFGLPSPDLVAPLKAAGIAILSTATVVAEARALEAAGADAVIAQGIEAGGHRGSFLAGHGEAELPTTLLLPRVLGAVTVPVIAAGGIVDAAGIKAAFAAGAAGVQLGTAFLQTDEASIDAVYRARLCDDAGPTEVTEVFSGRPARALVNRYVSLMASADPDDILPFPMQFALTAPLRAAAAAAGNHEIAAHWAGAVRLSNPPGPAAAFVKSLAAEAGLG